MPGRALHVHYLRNTCWGVSCILANCVQGMLQSAAPGAESSTLQNYSEPWNPSKLLASVLLPFLQAAACGEIACKRCAIQKPVSLLQGYTQANHGRLSWLRPVLRICVHGDFALTPNITYSDAQPLFRYVEFMMPLRFRDHPLVEGQGFYFRGKVSSGKQGAQSLPHLGCTAVPASTTTHSRATATAIPHAGCVPPQDGVDVMRWAFHLASCAWPAGGNAWLRRIAQEQSSLATSLPVAWSSSIFLAVDSTNVNALRCLPSPHASHWPPGSPFSNTPGFPEVETAQGCKAEILFYPCRALILGPDDTPYATGAFIFDILLPPEYPNKPPSVSTLISSMQMHCHIV